ncbi:MAG TPA: RNA 2',3'-cyclic phosphodiesterase [Acidobacteriaceae bacterium]|nr:RNA 2',3'-cyclic phosphodiesterase [Acidobacteriaceae bacterium]
MRLFVAIPILEQTTRELGEATARMRKRPGAQELRWSPPESWHITLQFLGNVDTDKFACLLQQLRKIHAQPLKIVPEKLGAFRRVGILYVSVKATPGLLGLEEQITAATALCGFAREDRPYHPHITLARSRGGGGWDGIASAADKNGELTPFTAFTAGEFALYESFLGGATRYEIRERFPLS